MGESPAARHIELGNCKIATGARDVRECQATGQNAPAGLEDPEDPVWSQLRPQVVRQSEIENPTRDLCRRDGSAVPNEIDPGCQLSAPQKSGWGPKDWPLRAMVSRSIRSARTPSGSADWRAVSALAK